MSETLRPTTADQLRDAIAWAAAEENPLEVIGAGTKRGLGRPLDCDHTLDLSALSGIVDYEPEELVISALAGTPLAEIEAALAEHNQMLAFEPPDLGPLWGAEAGRATLGGTAACNLSGPRRFQAGAARDHVLGVKGVSGRGEAFKSGGRVVKNVTGYDLSKLLCGSYGTLAVLSEIIVRTVPRPEKTRTVLAFGLAPGDAGRAMERAANSAFEVTGLAHLPADIAATSAVGYVAMAGASVTALRLEGPGDSVIEQTIGLRAALQDAWSLDCEVEELHGHNSGALWAEVGCAAAFAAGGSKAFDVWRLSLPPSAGPGLTLPGAGCRAFFDWAGGLVWLAAPPNPDARVEAVRAVVSAAGGGHATLLRAPGAVRAGVAVFQPEKPALAALSARVKASFDPRGILNPGRMVAGV
jgi:glycolate oxidase FAD binding subunit